MKEAILQTLDSKRSVCRKGKSIKQTVLEPLPLGIIPKSLKIKDVLSLLNKHFGTEWDTNPELKFYTEALES